MNDEPKRPEAVFSARRHAEERGRLRMANERADADAAIELALEALRKWKKRAEEAEAALVLAEKALKRMAGNDWTPAFIAREALAAIEALKLKP